MKKIIAIALTLCLMLTAFGAFAENVLNWSDIEPVIVEAGWEGEFMVFDEVAAKMWVPSVLLPVELTEEDYANGYIAYLITEDESAAVAVLLIDMEGMDLETYGELLPEVGASNIEFGTVNGLPLVTYISEESDSANMVAMTEDGFALEIIFSPMSDEGFFSVAQVMMGSLQAE